MNKDEKKYTIDDLEKVARLAMAIIERSANLSDAITAVCGLKEWCKSKEIAAIVALATDTLDSSQ